MPTDGAGRVTFASPAGHDAARATAQGCLLLVAGLGQSTDFPHSGDKGTESAPLWGREGPADRDRALQGTRG